MDRPTLLHHHKEQLRRWRDAINLVGPGRIEDHYEDCIAALRVLEAPQGVWADLGTGAGFPGIVFAAQFASCTVKLVESRAKRVAFINQVLADAGDAADHVELMLCRVETLPAGELDGVVSRAFAPPPKVYDHAFRLLKEGGLCVLFLQRLADVPVDERFETVRSHEYLSAQGPRVSVLVRKV